jgi:UDP-N-acetylmuramyl pentapeptide phosphotransferase/UDP-N-acetylglucosamine-1-phosphate transferase
MIFSAIAFIIASASAVFGYSVAKKFVRDRLRFVEGAHKPSTPFIAGIGAYLVAMVAVALLPIVGIGTAIAFALSVAFGTAAGSREVKSGNLPYLGSGY